MPCPVLYALRNLQLEGEQDSDRRDCHQLFQDDASAVARFAVHVHMDGARHGDAPGAARRGSLLQHVSVLLHVCHLVTFCPLSAVTLMFLYVLLRMDDVMADLTIDVNVVIGASSKPSETMVRSQAWTSSSLTTYTMPCWERSVCLSADLGRAVSNHLHLHPAYHYDRYQSRILSAEYQAFVRYCVCVCVRAHARVCVCVSHTHTHTHCLSVSVSL